MKVLITGASGFLGSYVTQALIREGYRVSCLVRDLQRFEPVLFNKTQVTLFEGDLFSSEVIAEAVKNCDLVVHCAAVVSFEASDKHLLYKTNVEGTRNLVNICIEAGVKTLLYASSIAVLGINRKIPEIDETAPWLEDGSGTWYGYTKYLGELEVWRGEAEGLQVGVINPSIILGIGTNYISGSNALIHYVYKKTPIYTDGWVNTVDVRDVAQAFTILAAKPELLGKRYILNGGVLPFKIFFEKIAKSLEVPAPSINMPRWLGEIGWRLIWPLKKLGLTQSLISAETVRNAFRKVYFKNERSRQVLNLSYHSIDETVQWACTGLKPLMDKQAIK